MSRRVGYVPTLRTILVLPLQCNPPSSAFLFCMTIRHDAVA